MATNTENITGIVQHRRGKTADWVRSTIIPYEGELVIEECVDGTCRCKIGDGINTFEYLSYVDAATEASISTLQAQVEQNSFDINTLNTNVSNLKREVAGIGSKVQSMVAPSIEKLDAMYSAKLEAMETQHSTDVTELRDILDKNVKDLTKSFEAGLSAQQSDVINVVNTKVDNASLDLSNEIDKVKVDLQRRMTDLASVNESNKATIESINNALNLTNESLSTSIDKIDASELKINELIEEVTKLKELGYGDIVTSEMIGQLRAVEVKVEQLIASDIDNSTQLISVKNSLNNVTRQLKELKNLHSTDLDAIKDSVAGLKTELSAADTEILTKINGELTKLWTEITDLVDDDIVLYETFVTTRNELINKVAKLKASLDAGITSVKKELSDTIDSKEIALKNLVATSKSEASAELSSAKAELTDNINSVKSACETTAKATTASIKTVQNDIVTRHTELVSKIAETDTALNQHKVATDGNFNSVDNKITDINKKLIATDARLTIDKERLDSQAKQISQLVRLEDGSTTGDAELVNARIGFDGKEYRSVGEYIRELDGSLKQHTGTDAITGLHYDTEGEVGLQQPYMLYLKNADGEILSDTGVQIISGAGGGTGGGSSTSSLKIEYITVSPVVVTKADKVVLRFNFSGVDSSGDEILQANAAWKINGETREYGVVNAGENEFDVTKYLKVGTTKVFLTVTDDNGRVVTKQWSVQQLDLSVQSYFDDKLSYHAGEDIIFTYVPYGAVDKTAVFVLDGEELARVKLQSGISGTEQKYQIPAQPHGAYLLEVYLEAEINGKTVPSDSIVKDILWYDPENSLPIIGAATQKFYSKQYATTNIVYTVYDPSTETPEVSIEVNGSVVDTNMVSANTEYGNTPTAVYSFVTDVVGTHTIKILCRGAEKTITVVVDKLGINATPITAGLAFDFNPVGRANGSDNRFWSHNGVSLRVSDNFDWTNGGYLPNDPDGPCFCIKAGSSATIDYRLFADDAKKYGKEFKLVFKTKNVANPNAVFLSCIDNTTAQNHIGIQMGAHNANIYGQSGNLELAYSEEDLIEFEFNISKSTDAVPMVMGYEDGVPSRPMVYNDTFEFKQNTPKEITLGSADCDLYIYRFKVYNTSLTAEEILQNFIADARTSDEMISRYNRNQIYDENHKLDPDVLAQKCPWLRVYKLSAPHFTNNKSDKVPDTTIQQLYKNGDPVLDNWTCYNAQHSGQGTSSNNYGAAGRNLDFIMNKSSSYFELGDGSTATEITLTRESIPTAYLNAKVNIASSNNLTNAILANRYNRFNPYKRAFVRKDASIIPFIKDTMEFHNCVIFIQETDPDLTTHREFADTDWHFYAIGNIGDSKKTDETRKTDINDKYECCVELMDVELPLSDFPANTMVDAMGYKEDSTTHVRTYIWANEQNLGMIDVDGQKIKDMEKCILHELIDGQYVKSEDEAIDFNKTYYVDILEHDDFSEDFTYGWRYLWEDGTKEENQEVFDYCKQKWIEFYRFVTTSSDEDFKAHLSDYFVIDSAIYYYLFTTRYCMVDNRAKNTFWHFGKTADGTRKWDLCWDYDNDTSLGLNNYGKQVYRYGLEDTDRDATGEEIFREMDSTFFCRIRDCFTERLKSTYNDLESKSAWHAESFIKECDDWQNEFPEELWRLDIDRKYIRTYTGSFINGEGDAQFLTNMANGKMKYHRRQWERSQAQYMASKYQTATAAGENSVFRCAVPTGDLAVQPNYRINLTPFAYMYLNVKYGTNSPIQVRVTDLNEPVEIPFTGTGADIIDIYNASLIQDFGDLSTCYVTTADTTKASRIRKLTLGNETEGYTNPSFTTLTTGANPLLEELNVENVTGLTQSLDLQALINLKKLYAFGTNVPSVLFADGGKLEYVELPAINNITLKNLHNLSSANFKLSCYDNVTDLSIEGCPLINIVDLLDKCTNVNRVRLIGVDFGNVTYNEFKARMFNLKGLTANGEETANAWLVGKIHFTDELLTGAQYNEIISRYPNLEVTYKKLESQLQFIQVDGETEYTEAKQVIINGGNGIDPVSAGSIQTPYKESNDEFEYEFVSWSTNRDFIIGETQLADKEALDNKAFNEVEGDRVLYPVFKAIRRSYEVVFINPNTNGDAIELQRVKIPYDSTIVYTGQTPVKLDPVASVDLYSFIGWCDSLGNIINIVTSDLVLYAQFAVLDATWWLMQPSEIQAGYSLDALNSTITIFKYNNPYNKAVKVPATLTIDGTVYTVSGVGGFLGNTILELVSIPDTAIEISYTNNTQQGAFEGCSNLVEITLPQSIQKIGNKAFFGCGSLSEIGIPANVSSIGRAAFAECTNLNTITVDSNNKYYIVIDNCLIEKSTNTLIQALPEAVIPDTVQNLGAYCFAKQPVVSIALPEGISTVASNAFNNCSDLTTVHLPNSMRVLDATCFSGCKKLADINLPEGLTTIRTYIFNECALETVTIPSTVTSLGTYSFGNMVNLKSVTFRPYINDDGSIRIPDIDNKAFMLDSGKGIRDKIVFNLPWSEEDHAIKFGSVADAWGATEAELNFNYVEG
jgi:hypothetical protein